MRISTPKSRQDLHIKKRYRVLEIGPGNNPSFRADVLADKFLGDDSHRSGGLRIYPHQNLEAVNDLSEDMRKDIDAIYEAIGALSVKLPEARKLRKPIGFVTGNKED